MLQHSQIRLQALAICFLENQLFPQQKPLILDISQYSSFCFRPQNSVVEKIYHSEKIHSRNQSFKKNFIGMEFQLQFFLQKYLYRENNVSQPLFVFRKNHKIVAIADIAFRFQLVFHELVKLVQIDIHEQLRS